MARSVPAASRPPSAATDPPPARVRGAPRRDPAAARRAACALAAALLAAAWPAGAGARLVETRIEVPASVADAHGRTHARPIVVTLWHDDATPEPRPVLVLNHGRATTREANVAMGRARYAEPARFLAGFGFVVAVPTRIGYGSTGGDDVESSGACARRDYPPAYRAAALQTLAVLDAVRRRPGVAQGRAVVMGQSFGGAAAIAVAAMAPDGVHAAINLAGGGGGNPELRPGAPCSAQALERLFADYGRAARMPTLWIYAENDRYFGAEWPRRWFDAFRDAGGAGRFVMLPPQGEDGHRAFTQAPQAWQPVVAAFLEARGHARVAPGGAATR